MIDFCIIGSGIAGSTISKILSKKYSVLVLDKARGPGGRSSNKRFQKNLSFDHGVQYISPKSKSFKKCPNHWFFIGFLTVASIFHWFEVWKSIVFHWFCKESVDFDRCWKAHVPWKLVENHSFSDLKSMKSLSKS